MIAMVRLLILSVAVCCALGCSSSSEKKSFTAQNETPHDFMFMQRAYPTGEIKTDAYSNAIRWKKEQQQRSNAAVLWEFAGPSNVGGRITDIEIPIDQSQTYYVGTASGGVFKTTDGGSTWIPIFDDQEMLSIGDIEISENNTETVWVGTGEVNAGGGSLAYDGNGMFKSTDGGSTWESKGLPNVGSISKIVIDPNDDNTIFVSAMGPLFRNDTNRGVYRSIDGGTTWEQKLFVSDITGVIDMAIHPTNGDIVYAASWERIRRPEFRQYGGETSRLYRSLDGGESWTEMTNGLPSLAADKGRISIDISTSNPNVLYSRYADAIGNIQGVYKTVDGGDVWTEVNSAALINVGFHWWFRGIVVDPSDENIIYNVDFDVQKSIDGGNTWSAAFFGAHVDQHALVFNKLVPGAVLLGNDGGLYYSDDDGDSYVKDITLPITQLYRVHVDAQNGAKVYGGAQDNNTIRTTTGSIDDWSPINGGDGFQPIVDHTNTDVIYSLRQNGKLWKSIDNGLIFFLSVDGISSGDRKNWDTPVVMDPLDSQILYYGANRLYKTTNAAEDWTAISPDLTNGPGGGNLSFGTIISISVSPIDTSTIYVGTDDGNVWITNDGGGSWNNISSTLPNRWVTKVLASRSDLNTVYVTFSGYRYGEDSGHVYKSDDNGANWTDISSGLPDIPVNDILEDSYGNLFLGTDIGVLASADQGVNWNVLGENLPSVVVTDMDIHEASEYLYIGTYGRSMYKLDIAEDILSVSNISFSETISIYPNPASHYFNISASESLENISVGIYDAMGREISRIDFSMLNRDERLSMEGFSKGMYFVRISNGTSQTTKKLLLK
ncbi:MAG: photosystem II stability/assembly factor-like uncharacterized protein [Flavobacteriaceae bacterium]|jgi:photosystem II stability/assembly factor-like uncharacterized protein